MPRAPRQLQNTDELKQARSKVSSIAGYYKNYKKKANEGYGGVVSNGRVTVGQARANDYIRAHKDDIWSYRTAFTVQFNAEHPDVRNAGLNERPAQEPEGHDENEQSGAHSEEGDLSMHSSSSNTENNVIGEQDGNIPGVNAPRQSLGPNALNGDEVENNASARERALPEGVVKEIANLERIEAYDLDRFFLGDTRNMLRDYFAITRPGGAGNENLAELDTKQSGRGVLSDKLDKADGRKSAAGGDPMNSDLTPGQEAGLSEIAKFLYQNCARRKRNKITLLDGLLLRSARERLLIYYLVEKNKYDSPAENHIVESQTYTPDIEKFKKSIERSGFNIFGRMFIGSMHWSYLSKAAQVAMDCREKLMFMAASGMFAQGGQEIDDGLRRRAGELLGRYPNSYTNLMRGHNILEVIEEDVDIIRLNNNAQGHHEEENHEEQNHDLNQDSIDGLSEIHGDEGSNPGDQSLIDIDRELPGGDVSSGSIDLSQLEDEERQDGDGAVPEEEQSEIINNQDVAEDGAQQRANAREQLILKRNEAFTLAMNIGNAYIAMWKSKGALPEDQMPWVDAQELKGMAMAYTVALKKLVNADNAVMRSQPDAPQPMQGNVPYVPDNVGEVVKKGLTSTSTVAARKQEKQTAGIVSKKNMSSLGYMATTSVTMVDKARNIGMVLNPDMWSGSGNWNWGNPDFGKHLSESMANQWGWRLDGVFPRIEGAGTGICTTIGAIAALATFASGLTKMGATFKGGSTGDKAKYITNQLGLLVSASKDAMLDTVAWNNVFHGSISPQIIANLSSAAAVAGVVGGAINIALGAASIHTGRTAKKRLDDIGDWVVQNVQRGRNQDASPEQQRESEIINTANAAARRKADHYIRAGASQTVSGALFMVGGILSMSVAGAPLGAAIMLLGGGLSLVNSIVGYTKSKQRRREMIDDYIGMNTLISAVKRYDPNAADLEDSELAEYIREEAIGLMGFTSENGCFDYIAGRLSKALIEGIRKNARMVEPDELQAIVQNPYDFIGSDVHEKKQVANYILMIQSFGPKVKITRNRAITPNETALAKSIAKV